MELSASFQIPRRRCLFSYQVVDSGQAECGGRLSRNWQLRHVSSRGWIELHNPQSNKMSIKLFNINNCASRAASKAATVRDSFTAGRGTLALLP